MTIVIICNLYCTSTQDGDNIANHLNKLKQYLECINLMADNDFKISNNQFKVLISSSFPSAWDTFTEAYVSQQRDISETDPKKLMSSQQFISVIKEEAVHHNACRTETSHQTISILHSLTSKSKYCAICKHNNYNTNECWNCGKRFCNICNKPNHNKTKCWYQK